MLDHNTIYTEHYHNRFVDIQLPLGKYVHRKNYLVCPQSLYQLVS